MENVTKSWKFVYTQGSPEVLAVSLYIFVGAISQSFRLQVIRAPMRRQNIRFNLNDISRLYLYEKILEDVNGVFVGVD